MTDDEMRAADLRYRRHVEQLAATLTAGILASRDPEVSGMLAGVEAPTVELKVAMLWRRTCKTVHGQMADMAQWDLGPASPFGRG